MITQWSCVSQIAVQTSGLFSKQATWDLPLILREFCDRFQYKHISISMTERSVCRTCQRLAPPLPIILCGLRLDGVTTRVAVDLRLSMNICVQNICPWGEQVMENGSHGLSCKLGPGWLPCHSRLNDIFYQALVWAGIPSVKEPLSLLRPDEKRPDGMTMIPS